MGAKVNYQPLAVRSALPSILSEPTPSVNKLLTL